MKICAFCVNLWEQMMRCSISIVLVLFILMHTGVNQRGSGCLLLSPLSFVCVCVFLVGRSLVCSTCVWHYCDKAAQPLWGDGECQRLESRSEQLPNIWWNEKHTRWMAGLLTPQRGSRAVGGGQVKPQLCVWNITLSLFSFCFLPNVHISTHILKHHSTHTGISSNNTVFTGIIRCLFSSFLTAGEMLELLYLEHSWLKTHPL